MLLPPLAQGSAMAEILGSSPTGFRRTLSKEVKALGALEGGLIRLGGGRPCMGEGGVGEDPVITNRGQSYVRLGSR